jgi:hypothetical protein
MLAAAAGHSLKGFITFSLSNPSNEQGWQGKIIDINI